jgi:hypothetical protein
MAAGMQQGYLIIADISGYTAYLTGTELEHAQDVLGKLIQSILDAFQPPVRLVELEGDAVYVYLPASEAAGARVLEIIEGAYFAFARQRELIEQVAPCVCLACRSVPMLDLKFVVHFGEFAVQELAGRAKPIGPDVILVHRLLKNSIAEAMGLHAYIFFTDAALTRLGLDAAALGMRPHREEYEHLGVVSGAVRDLVVRWATERQRERLRLDSGTARAAHTVEVPAPPDVVWAYLTRPVFRARWEPAAGAVADEHSIGAAAKAIVDWQPFRYYTARRPLDAPLHPPGVLTTELAPTADGTRITWYCAPSTAGWRTSLGLLLGQGRLLAPQHAGGERLREVLAAEWAPAPAAPSDDAAAPASEPRP